VLTLISKNNRKRSREVIPDIDYDINSRKRSKINVTNSETDIFAKALLLFSNHYKMYKGLTEPNLLEVQNFDHQFNISASLSSTITQTFMLQKFIYTPSSIEPIPYSTIQLVKTSELINFREYDRSSSPKIFLLEESIKKFGFQDALILEYCKESNTCLLQEGNHRLAVAIKANIEFVPVRVVSTSSCTPNSKAALCKSSPKLMQQKYVLPSDLNFSVYQPNTLFHPYFPEKWEHTFQSLNKYNLKNNDVDETVDEVFLTFNELFSLPTSE